MVGALPLSAWCVAAGQGWPPTRRQHAVPSGTGFVAFSRAQTKSVFAEGSGAPFGEGRELIAGCGGLLLIGEGVAARG